MYSKHKWKSDKYYNFGYLEYLPNDYDNTKNYPIVFFLHGAGERGEDLDLVARHGYLRYIREENKEYPFIIVAPQCPEKKYWGCVTESLLAFFDWISVKYSVDKKRVYLTGLSMGGTGTWMLAMADPKRFAAIAPVCGSGICWNTQIIKDIPVYMYHGDCDDIVPLYESVTMLKNINKNGGNAQLEICYGVGHNAWDYAYSTQKLQDWFLTHTNSEN